MSRGEGCWSIGEVLRWTTERFQEADIPSPRLDAELLIAHAVACTRIDLYLRHDMPLAPDERLRLRALVLRRLRDRVPVAYLVGHKDFFGLRFEVCPDVLIPRPETEAIVQAALEHLGAKAGRLAASAGPHLIDVGTGSGAIAIALLHELPWLHALAVDLSPAALALAGRNACTHGVQDRIRFLESDLLAALAGLPPVAAIVSNPPYVGDGDREALSPEIRAHEPPMALFAEEEGMALLRRLAREAADMLGSGGLLAMETGSSDQTAAMLSALAADPRYDALEPVEDIAGRARGVQALRRPF